MLGLLFEPRRERSRRAFDKTRDVPRMSNLASELRRAFWPWRENTMPSATPVSRYLLWIDSVGGFYLCTGSCIRIGQAVPGNSVELPLLADLSRHHATIR